MADFPLLDTLSLGLTAYNTNAEALDFFERLNLVPTRGNCNNLALCSIPNCNSRMRAENSDHYKIGWRMRYNFKCMKCIFL